MATSLIDDALKRQSELVLSLEDYAYGLAKHGSPSDLSFLFRKMPFLMNHITSRPSCDSDWQYLSIPWAIFDQRKEYDNSAKECLRVLEFAGFKPNGHFIERMIWKAWPEMVRDFCEIFKIDSTHAEGYDLSVLRYAVSCLESEEGLEIFRELLVNAGDVNKESGSVPKTVLMDLFTSTPPQSSDMGNNLIGNVIQAIDWLLEAGANPNASGMMNGWVHDGGKGERLPTLHGVYWAEYTGRADPEIVEKAKAVCDPSLKDHAGRTAAEYKKLLVESKAPK